jgi:glycine oxidase
MFDFLIIGGGIIGLLTAKELQKTGAKVAIIEKNSPGQQATWAAGGILSPMRPWLYSSPVNAISSLSQVVYQQLSTELHDETGIDPEWMLSGMLVLHDDEMAQAIQWCEQNDSPIEVLTVNELSRQFGHLKPLGQTAIYRSDVATIKPHKLSAALTRYLTAKGVSFYNSQEAKQLTSTDQTITGVQLANSTVSAGEYIICGGAWSTQLIPDVCPKPIITPVKGQMLCFPPTELSNLCMVMDGNRYIIPRKGGRIVVGSTRENTDFDASTTQAAYDDLKGFAQQLYPALANIEPDAHWAGLRPTSPQSIPYICRVEPFNNLSLNAGHYRNGIVTAPASAELMADILLNRITKIDTEPYKITR